MFDFDLPLDFVTTWLRERLFEQKPERLSIPVAPTREFCVALFTAKIKATIKNLGDMIGWEDDDNVVGPVALAAKQSLLRLIPHILPAGSDSEQRATYRLVLEHGDFGIHNMSITKDSDGRPLVTSLYDWETACIVPALLSDPLIAVAGVDLVMDDMATPSITRVAEDETPDNRAQYMTWARQYIKVVACCVSLQRKKVTDVLRAPRLSSIKHPIMNMQARQGRMHGMSGLRCEIGEVIIRKSSSVIWELGLRED